MPSGQSGTIEFNISAGNNEGWGGDFVRTASGDLQLVADGPVTPIPGTNQPVGYPNAGNLQPTPTVALATQQRLTRMFFLTPVLYDANNNPLNFPDDIGNPRYGIGAPALVDESIDYASTVIQNAASKQIARDPAIVGPPNVTFTEDALGTLLVSIGAQTNSGQPVATPSLSLAALIGPI